MKAPPKAGTRKPMSGEARQKIPEAQFRRHKPDAATSNAASITESDVVRRRPPRFVMGRGGSLV